MRKLINLKINNLTTTYFRVFYSTATTIDIIVTRDGIIASRLAIEKLVALRCTGSKNWNGNPNAVPR